MNKTNRFLLIAALGTVSCLGLACAHFMEHEDDSIALEKTPPAVQAGINKILAGEKADKIEMENEDGKTVYEVTYHVKGQERSADFATTGELLSQESDIAVPTLPAAVSSVIQQKYPGAKVEEAAEVSAGGQMFYEAAIETADHKDRELQINADGSVRADKVKADEKKEKPEKK